MNGKRDYYEVLGLDRSASNEEIKRAYRRLARQHHPDVNPNDPDSEERFKEVVEAYEALSDAERRMQYDHFGHVGGAGMSDFGFGGFSDLIESFFGGGFGGRTRATVQDLRGADLRVDVELTLEEVALGADKEIRVSRQMQCNECQGRGGSESSKTVICPNCRGEGRVRHASGVFGIQFTSVAACERCQGEGRLISDPCPSCQGQGRKKKAEKMKIHIPPGADSGHRLQLRGEGDVGLRGASPGDLYVVTHILPHNIFERRGTEIICEVPLPFTIAALGGKLEVPTLGEAEELKIPAGTQTGTAFRLRGKGLPDPNGQVRGDEHIIVKVSVPTHLSAKQRQLLKQLAEESDEDDKGLLERMKEALGGDG